MRRGSLALTVVLVLLVPGVAAGADPIDAGLLGVRPEGGSEPASPRPTTPMTATSSEAASDSPTSASTEAIDPWIGYPPLYVDFDKLPPYLQDTRNARNVWWAKASPMLRAYLMGAKVDATDESMELAYSACIGATPTRFPEQIPDFRDKARRLRDAALIAGPLKGLGPKPPKVETKATPTEEKGRGKGEEKKGEKNPSPAEAGAADNGLQRLTRQLRRMTSDVKGLGEAVRGLRTATDDLIEAFGALARLGQEPPRCSPDPRAARLQTAATCFMAVVLVSRAQAGTSQGGQDRPRSRAAELAAARNAARQIDALVRRNEALMARVRQLEARDARMAAAEERIRRLEEENRRLRASRVGLRVAFETKDRGVTRNVVLQITKVTGRSRRGKPLVMARR